MIETEIRPLVSEEHREAPSHGNTPTYLAAWNVSNIILGIGLLGVPYACAILGWLSIPAVLLFGLLSLYTGILIGRAMYNNPDAAYSPPELDSHESPCKRVYVTFADIAKQLLPRFGKPFAASLVILEIFGAQVLYTILLGESLAKLLNTNLNTSLSREQWAVVIAYCVFPFTFIQSIKVISCFSTAATACLIGVTLGVVSFCIMSALSMQQLVSEFGLPVVDKLPSGLAIILFSYCCHGVLPGIEYGMKFPRSYPKMMTVTFGATILIKALFGVLPAYLFGRQTAQIFLDNMSPAPRLQLTVQILITVTSMLTIPLTMYFIRRELDVFVKLDHFRYKHGSVKALLLSILIQLIIYNLGLVIAVFVPEFALIMALIGSITGSFLVFILPPLFMLSFCRQIPLPRRVLFWFLIVFGIIVLIFGVVFSTLNLLQAYQLI
ncbi:hypothetical protein Ciccas_002846 [Cichlidogyrus casuarinus]|uniref:Amino acid transporter transmembrane domain-containing protein n=1 Tax=Cichlidogyrus casuarinus TaxID=1844966 RepID=A0ABD2QG24_9PLAT